MERPAGSRVPGGWKGVLWFLGWAALFTAAYGLAPLYYSNQNQYFLHGLAAAGEGELHADWLANTRDPTPLFSGLIALTARYGHPWLFHVYYALLLGAYFAAAVGIFSVVARPEDSGGARFAFCVLFLLVHASVLRVLSMRLFGIDYPWYVQTGLAAQYVNGPMFQPSVFGIFLVVSLYAWARERPVLAAGCAGLAAMCHSTYLLPAALLTLAYCAVLLWERRGKVALAAGGLALLLALPAVVYTLVMFRPSGPVFVRAQEILVHFRIPHHAIPRLWFDELALAQVGWMALGIALAWRTRLFSVLLISSLLALSLTLVQLATDNETLALLFPWRLSSVIVPVATAVILARLVQLGARWLGGVEGWKRATAWAVGVATVAVLVVVGALVMYLPLGFYTSDAEQGLLAYVRTHKQPGDCYLLPVGVPDLESKVDGSRSGTFKPLKEMSEEGRFITVDLQNFRLATGAPIYVDFKSIPYSDREVAEWRDRVARMQEIYAHLREGQERQAAREMRKDGITHVVTAGDRELDEGLFRLAYEDDFYRVYRVRSVPTS
jgi:hypothetical protein